MTVAYPWLPGFAVHSPAPNLLINEVAIFVVYLYLVLSSVYWLLFQNHPHPVIISFLFDCHLSHIGFDMESPLLIKVWTVRRGQHQVGDTDVNISNVHRMPESLSTSDSISSLTDKIFHSSLTVKTSNIKLN